MTRTPDEIKKGLEHAAIDCRDAHDCDKTCAYYKECTNFDCEITEVPCTMLFDALALIQQLQAELEDMTARYKIADDCAKKKGKMNEKLYAELVAVKAERDALIEELKNAYSCFACKKFYRNGGECKAGGVCMMRDFEWRGVQKEV